VDIEVILLSEELLDDELTVDLDVGVFFLNLFFSLGIATLLLDQSLLQEHLGSGRMTNVVESLGDVLVLVSFETPQHHRDDG